MRIVILVDLLRLQAHDTHNTYAFGVSFAPSIYLEPGEPPPPAIFTTDLLNAGGLAQIHDKLTQEAGVLAPWCWNKDDASIQVFCEDGSALHAGADVNVIPLPAGRNLVPNDLDTIEGNIIAHCVYAGGGDPMAMLLSPPSLSPPSTPPSSQQDLPPNTFHYPAFIQTAAGWPAPVPHGRLNFVKFFRVTKASLGANSWIVAIPIFTVGMTTFKTVMSPASPPPPYSAPPPPYQPLPNEDNRFIDYYYSTTTNLGPIANVLVQARCAQCSISLPSSTSSFVDLSTLWVRPALSGNDAISGDAWFEELPSRLASAFDLPTCILNALGQDDGSPPQQSRLDLRLALINQGGDEAADLVIALILRALHDLLGPAVVATDLSSTTQGDLAQRLVMLLPDKTDGTDIAKLKKALLNALVESFPITLQRERDPNAWKGDANSSNKWIGASNERGWVGRLAARLSAISDLPADPKKFLAALRETTKVAPTASPFSVERLAFTPFVVERLMSVVAMCMRPDVLTDLIVDAWGAISAGSPDPLGQATAAALQDLELAINVRGTIAQKGLIVMRARRSVLQPAWMAPDGIFQRSADGAASDLTLLGTNTCRAFASYGLGTLARAPAVAGSPPLDELEADYAWQFIRSELLEQNARNALEAALEDESRLLLGEDLTKSSILDVTEDMAGPGTVTPGGITIQFDRIIRGPKDPQAGQTDDDFNQNLAGYGILIKLVDAAAPLSPPLDAMPGTWRALNVTNIGIGPQDPPPTPSSPPSNLPPASQYRPPPPPLNDFDNNRIETVTPLTPVYDEESLPTAAVHYDNAPITGVANIVRRPDPTGETINNQYYSEPLIVSLQPLPAPTGDTRSALARLPFLAFGTGIQYASFVVTNQGALPFELADSNFPALLSQNFISPPPQYIGPVYSSQPYFPYLRRVAVGPLGLPEDVTGQRFSSPQSNTYNAFSIDPSVRLIADELVKNGTSMSPPTTSLTPIDLTTPHQRPTPRALLLAQHKNNMSRFFLRAPSVDFEVFDRWMAFDEFIAIDPVRRRQIRDYRNALRDAFDEASLNPNKTKDDGDKYSIGDPAIGLFYMRARCIFRDGAQIDPSTELIQQPVTMGWSRTIDQLLNLPARPENTHRPQIQVILKAWDGPAPPPGQRLIFDSGHVKLLIDEGEVWVADVFAGVPMDLVYARFDQSLHDRCPSMATVGGKDYWLVAPFTFMLECATRDLPTAEQVYAAFLPDLSRDEIGAITFSWQREESPAGAAVGAINVGWQQWRPTGRPPSPFPYNAIGNLDQVPSDGSPPDGASAHTNAVLWELEAFAGRPDAPSKGRRFAPKLIPQNATPLFDETPSPPGPARYIRFEVNAESRYASLYDNPPLKLVSGQNNNSNWPTSWKRLFRPAMPKTVPTLKRQGCDPPNPFPRSSGG
jgi:hypothetical protein